jgi:hypothetical protein
MNGGSDGTQGFSGPCQPAQMLVTIKEYHVLTNANISVNRMLDWRGKLVRDVEMDDL